MKSIKECIANIAMYGLYGLLAATPIGIIQYQAHNSGFVRSYNEAVQRNADINGDGQITPTEELIFKQSLLKEIAGLGEQTRDLDEIVDWLKIR